MTDFERQVYVDMSSADRVALWMVKSLELKKLAQAMTKKDIALLKRILQQEITV